MTTINSSSPASIWFQAQSAAPATIQTPPADVQTTATAVTDSVQLSDAAIALLNAESDSTEPPVEANSSGSGNDPPGAPPVKTAATPQSSGSGNDVPIKT